MDIREVRQLIKLVEASNISEVEIEEDGKKLRITKNFASKNGDIQVIPGPPVYSAPVAPVPFPQAVPVVSETPPAASPAPVSDESSNLIDVRSPMVGTFYAAPSRDADNYVEIGTPVSTGQTLCIIEAMKLMNEIENEVAGKIKEILVENAQPVEYNQVLFRIEKS